MKPRLILFCFFAVISLQLHSQALLDWGISVDYAQGKTLKHRPNMVFDLPNPSRDFRLEAWVQTHGKKPWHSLFRFPKIGVGSLFIDYGNAEVLGKVYGIYGFIDEAFVRKGPITLFGRFDHGLAYHTRIFDPFDNPLNNAIGSRLNLHASLGLRMEYRISRRLSLRLGGYFVHQSNARITVPNLGLNTAKWVAGLSFFSEPNNPFPLEPVEKKTGDFPFKMKKWQAIPKLGLGLKEERVHNGPKYPIYVVGFQLARNVKNKRRYLFGVEGLWNMAHEAFKVNQDIEESPISLHTFNPSISLGHEYLFGRIGLLTQGNIYLRNTFQRRSFWSAKIGSHLYLHSNYDSSKKSNLFVGVYIKTHLAIADFLEFGLGYQF